MVPVIISVANKNPDRQLLRRVVIEGYASKSGTYLHNLQLSMRRAEEVLCGLFENPGANERGLTLEEKQVVETYFWLAAIHSMMRATGQVTRPSE